MLLWILVSTQISEIMAQTCSLDEEWVCVWDFSWAKLTDLFFKIPIHFVSMQAAIGIEHILWSSSSSGYQMFWRMCFLFFFKIDPFYGKISFRQSLRITYFQILWKTCLRCSDFSSQTINVPYHIILYNLIENNLFVIINPYLLIAYCVQSSALRIVENNKINEIWVIISKRL